MSAHCELVSGEGSKTRVVEMPYFGIGNEALVQPALAKARKEDCVLPYPDTLGETLHALEIDLTHRHVARCAASLHARRSPRRLFAELAQPVRHSPIAAGERNTHRAYDEPPFRRTKLAQQPFEPIGPRKHITIAEGENVRAGNGGTAVAGCTSEQPFIRMQHYHTRMLLSEQGRRVFGAAVGNDNLIGLQCACREGRKNLVKVRRGSVRRNNHADCAKFSHRVRRHKPATLRRPRGSNCSARGPWPSPEP